MIWRNDSRPSSGRSSHPERRTLRDEPLAGWTTLGVGGPAERLEIPASVLDLRTLVAECRDSGTPWRALGRGSNLVVSDAGVTGVVIHTDALRYLRFHEPDPRADHRRVTAGAGLPTSVLLSQTRARGLGGLESLVGYPATVGGATRMNAGGRWGYVGERVESVRLVTPDGDLRDLDARACRFGYRTSALSAGVVAEVTFCLPRVDGGEYRARVESIQREKRRTQPLAQQSAGCVFRNPPGDSAGRLVEAAGMKGRVRGAAQVSAVHGNFVVNWGGARAADVLDLAAEVRDAVEARFGVRLELEVEVWGGAHVPAGE